MLDAVCTRGGSMNRSELVIVVIMRRNSRLADKSSFRTQQRLRTNKNGKRPAKASSSRSKASYSSACPDGTMARRKPRRFSRRYGRSLHRYADRQYQEGNHQQPPRFTRRIASSLSPSDLKM